MDFSLLDLDAHDQALRAEVRLVIETYVTPEVRIRVAADGSSHDEDLWQALAQRGWILPDHSVEVGGAGLSPIQCELIDLELERADAPLMALDTTRLALPAVERFGRPELAEEVVAAVATGAVRLCLGYTEPDNGSDIAAAKTRAVRDGDHWVINGTKVFTTEAHHCHYAFLIARTDPGVAKHKGLTMFLVPLDTPGIEISPILTVGGERTNAVYYSDVRISDRYRLGEVNGGWAVLMEPLSAEHGTDSHTTQISLLSKPGKYSIRALERALDVAVDWMIKTNFDGGSDYDRAVVLDRLATIAIALEASAYTPDPMGRYYAFEVGVDGCAELLNLVGPASIIQADSPGNVGDGVLESAHRFMQGTGIYGGTTEVFKNVAAQHVLGLPRQLPPAR